MRRILWPVGMALGLAVLATAAVGCDDGGGSCGQPPEVEYFESGEFTSEGGTPVDYYCSAGCSTVFTPHDGGEDFGMELDLEENVATISYTRDGTAVVERWTVASRASQ